MLYSSGQANKYKNDCAPCGWAFMSTPSQSHGNSIGKGVVVTLPIIWTFSFVTGGHSISLTAVIIIGSSGSSCFALLFTNGRIIVGSMIGFRKAADGTAYKMQITPKSSRGGSCAESRKERGFGNIFSPNVKGEALLCYDHGQQNWWRKLTRCVSLKNKQLRDVSLLAIHVCYCPVF